MKIPVCLMTQEELNEYLERLVEAAFREGMLWEKCGADKFCSFEQAVNSAKNSIVYEGV